MGFCLCRKIPAYSVRCKTRFTCVCGGGGGLVLRSLTSCADLALTQCKPLINIIWILVCYRRMCRDDLEVYSQCPHNIGNGHEHGMVHGLCVCVCVCVCAVECRRAFVIQLQHHLCGQCKDCGKVHGCCMCVQLSDSNSGIPCRLDAVGYCYAHVWVCADSMLSLWAIWQHR